MGEIMACFYDISNNPSRKKIDHVEERGRITMYLDKSGYAISFTNQDTEKVMSS